MLTNKEDKTKNTFYHVLHTDSRIGEEKEKLRQTQRTGKLYLEQCKNYLIFR